MKVCDDICYQVKGMKGAEICSEEAAVTDTRPAWCCMYSHASTVYLVVIDCCQYSRVPINYFRMSYHELTA